MRKILVGVDLSPESELAVAHAVDVARHTGAEVVLAMADAVPSTPDPTVRGVGTMDEWVRVLQARLAADRAGLAALRERWLGQGAEIAQVVVDGYADEQLPQVAAEVGADLITIGTHGRTGVKRLLLGSVAERVVRLAAQSVLVVRGAAPSGGYRRIVVGTDFSALAGVALDQALALAARGARIDIVHCWNVSPWLAAPELSVGALAPMRAELVTDLEGEGEALAIRIRARTDAEVRFRLVERPPARGLDELAAELAADLVVVGSHGRRGVRRFVLGSVAEVTTRHATCSVLVAR